MRPDYDNNPSSNPQNQPDQTLSQSKELTLQPIHSEDEIRKELAENRPSYDTANPDGSDETTPDGEDAIGDNPSSTLRTEPIKPLTYANPATNNYSTRAKTEPRKKGITIKSVVGLVILLVIAGLIWYLFFSEKVRTSDLVEESVGNTTYLRPQQWKKTEVMENSFGTPDIEEGKFRNLVAVNISGDSFPNFLGLDDELSMMRTMLMSMSNEESFASQMSSPDSPCQSTKPLEKAEDRTKTDSSFGLMRITLSCERDKIPYTMKIRGVIGMDGHTRMIHIMAKDSVWQQNEEAFETMLMSLDQTKNTSVE